MPRFVLREHFRKPDLYDKYERRATTDL